MPGTGDWVVERSEARARLVSPSRGKAPVGQVLPHRPCPPVLMAEMVTLAWLTVCGAKMSLSAALTAKASSVIVLTSATEWTTHGSCSPMSSVPLLGTAVRYTAPSCGRTVSRCAIGKSLPRMPSSSPISVTLKSQSRVTASLARPMHSSARPSTEHSRPQYFCSSFSGRLNLLQMVATVRFPSESPLSWWGILVQNGPFHGTCGTPCRPSAVDSRHIAHCFRCSQPSLISPRSASRRSPMAFRCVVTSDFSILTARTGLWVYRSWISTVSMAISSVLQPHSAHFNCNSFSTAAWNAWSAAFSWLA